MTSAHVTEITSVPAVFAGPFTVIDTGLEIMVFSQGNFIWSQMVSNESKITGAISKYSTSFIDPVFFSIALGDGRFSVYDLGTGLCYASLALCVPFTPRC